MERVLAQAGCFRPLSDKKEMQLTPNSLTHLEVRPHCSEYQAITGQEQSAGEYIDGGGGDG
jgi:hypothetical protein